MAVDPVINQDPNHTPHPVLPPTPLVQAAERTLVKAARDFIVFGGGVIILGLFSQHVPLAAWLPALGPTVYRVGRDVAPAAWDELFGQVSQ